MAQGRLTKIISMIKWIQTSRSSMNYSLSMHINIVPPWHQRSALSPLLRVKPLLRLHLRPFLWGLRLNRRPQRRVFTFDKGDNLSYSIDLYRSGDTTPCKMTGVPGDATPCRMTGVPLHGVASPGLKQRPLGRVFTKRVNRVSHNVSMK